MDGPEVIAASQVRLSLGVPALRLRWGCVWRPETGAGWWLCHPQFALAELRRYCDYCNDELKEVYQVRDSRDSDRHRGSLAERAGAVVEDVGRCDL